MFELERPNPHEAIAASLENGTFEQILQSLDETLALLESGELSLAESVEIYALGIELSRKAESILKDAELRITQLSALDEAE